MPKRAFMLVKANSVMTVHKPSTSRPSPAKLRELLAIDAVTNAVQYLLTRQLFTHIQETLEGGRHQCTQALSV